MDSVISKLTEIEMTAERIVSRAEERKNDTMRSVLEQRHEFDTALAKRTEETLAQIREESDRKMNRMLEAEKQRQHSVIDNLEKEYEENHEAYAREILKHIIAV